MNEHDCNDLEAMIANYLSDEPDFASHLMEKALNAVLEGEMTALLKVEKGERSTA